MSWKPRARFPLIVTTCDEPAVADLEARDELLDPLLSEVAQHHSLGELEDAAHAAAPFALLVAPPVAIVILQDEVADVDQPARSQDAPDLVHRGAQVLVGRQAGEDGEAEGRAAAPVRGGSSRRRCPSRSPPRGSSGGGRR